MDKSDRTRKVERATSLLTATPLAVAVGAELLIYRPDTAVGPSEIRRLPFEVPNNNRLLLKLEHLTRYSATGSLYDRLYASLFAHYEAGGYIAPRVTPLIEGSVGNAGAAFAHVAQVRGYHDYTVLLPQDIYPARIDQIRRLGAKVLFSPKNTAELGYVEILEAMVRDAWRGRKRLRGDVDRLFPVSKVLRVPNAPYARLLWEVLEAAGRAGLPQHIDYFVFGVGAGNTISEVGRAIKTMSRGLRKVVAVEFTENPFVALLKAGRRPPVGGPWPAGAIAETISGVPLDKLNLDLEIIDAVSPITAAERKVGRQMANEELALFAGRPTGGLIYKALELAGKVSDTNILTIVFDSIAKYGDEYEPIWDIDFGTNAVVQSPQVMERLALLSV